MNARDKTRTDAAPAGPRRGAPARRRGAAPGVPMRVRTARGRNGVRIAYVLTALTASGVVAVSLFRGWSGTDPVPESYPMPGLEGLSFSSPQTREVAQQIQPFIDKNTR